MSKQLVLALSTLTLAALMFVADVAATVTGGSITGTTAEFAGTVVLDGSGITIDAGSGSANQVKWTDGSGIFSQTDNLRLSSQDEINFTLPNFANIEFSEFGITPTGVNDGLELGTSSDPWDKLWVESEIQWASPPTTTSSDDPVVYSSGNAKLYRKTNGFSGTCAPSDTLTVQSGIIVGCS